MTGIIFVTQLIDEDDPVLGFTPGLVRALARRTDVAVIAGEVRSVPSDLGAEVVSLGRERGWGRWRRGLQFEASLAAMCRRLRPATLYAHMCPDYVTIAAPVTRLTGTPSILWFTHSADTPTLRRAERIADQVVTALPGSFPYASAKVRAIGHSIDTRRFSKPDHAATTGTLELVAVGRCSTVKNYPVIVRGVARARERGLDVRLRVLGPATTLNEVRLRDELQGLIEELDMGSVATLMDGVPPAQVADVLAGASALVNASRPGQADKVVFEAMACERPALVSSPAFRGLLADLPMELLFADDDQDALADAIARLSTSSPTVLNQTGALLRQRVVAHHSLDHWADEVVALAASLRAERRPRCRVI